MSNYNLTTASGVFKTKYVRMTRDMFNSENVILAKIKRNDAFVGEFARISVPTSFGGGRGSGSLPRPNVASYQRMDIYAKKQYVVIEIDNEAIEASGTDEGAFVRLSKEPVKRGVQAFQGNMSRQLFNDSITSNGNGRLGTFSGNQSLASAGVYNVTIETTTWKQANFETKDFVNVNTNSAEFEITAVTPSTRVVQLTQRQGAAFDLASIGAGTHSVYMQNSKDNDCTGLRGVLLATSGSLYGINVGYRWQSPYQDTSVGVGLTSDYLNKGNLQIKYNFGEAPDMLVTSFVQYRKLLNQLEDQKRYMIVESRNSGPKGKFSFQALEFMSDTGPIPVVAERFVEDDTFYFLNSDFIEMHARPNAGWQETPDATGGSIFQRSQTSDAWQARYCTYPEFGIVPTAHGIITGLTTT